MRFYAGRHGFYCGIDLHARWMYVCILSRDGEIVYHENLPAGPEPFLKAVAPYCHELVVGVECIFVYPPEMRSTRDLMRRRTYLVRRRADLLAHLQNTNSQYNLPEFGKKIARKRHREGIAQAFADRFEHVQDFCSYFRLVKCAHESAGKRSGKSWGKIGNVHLKWAFSEAAVLFLRVNPDGMKYKQRLGTSSAIRTAATPNRGRSATLLPLTTGGRIGVRRSRSLVPYVDHHPRSTGCGSVDQG